MYITPLLINKKIHLIFIIILLSRYLTVLQEQLKIKGV
ncbi:hypothetical protein P262_04468 [Cronobacter malonaticus]|uniref:Uncharacterized protein n=1 Tax=Cronobacter malonaticus TaxID=413503 RepID=V5U207_9ENTR|nr:hypothetical protein P262_04468 [Cronobacter malonaticus]